MENESFLALTADIIKVKSGKQILESFTKMLIFLRTIPPVNYLLFVMHRRSPYKVLGGVCI